MFKNEKVSRSSKISAFAVRRCLKNIYPEKQTCSLIVFYIATYFVSYFNIIIDIRNVDDDLSDETIKAYTEGVKPVQVFTEKIKVAVITYSPSQVAGATLYKLFESKAIECEVFSTLEIALHWLGIDEIDFGKIDFYKKV